MKKRIRQENPEQGKEYEKKKYQENLKSKKKNKETRNIGKILNKKENMKRKKKKQKQIYGLSPTKKKI